MCYVVFACLIFARCISVPDFSFCYSQSPTLDNQAIIDFCKQQQGVNAVPEYVEYVDYLEIARRQLEPFLTAEVTAAMLAGQITVTVEIISKEDNTHASVAAAERVVVTCVSSDASDGRSVTYLSPADMHDFGMRFGFGTLPRVHMKGTHGEIKAMGQLIFADRDGMGVPSYSAAIADVVQLFPGHVTLQAGNTEYYEWSPKIQEGLIIFYFDAEGNVIEAQKLKFAMYVIRTMLLRLQLQLGNLGEGKEAVLEAARVKFLEKWTTSVSGLKYWGLISKAYLMELMNLLEEETSALVDGVAVGLHIIAGDNVDCMTPSEVADLVVRYDNRLTSAMPKASAMAPAAVQVRVFYVCLLCVTHFLCIPAWLGI